MFVSAHACTGGWVDSLILHGSLLARLKAESYLTLGLTFGSGLAWSLFSHDTRNPERWCEFSRLQHS